MYYSTFYKRGPELGRLLPLRTEPMHTVYVSGARAEAKRAQHIAGLVAAVTAMNEALLSDWGSRLSSILAVGGRLLVAGNGGSAAEAQHLAAELVGRYSTDRRPLAAIALTADTATITALGNDFGFTEVFARQVRAHGRPGDVLLLLSTSGRSANLIEAAAVAHAIGMVTWALTGPLPNTLADASDEHVAIAAESVANVQEAHLVAIHIICAAVDAALAATETTPTLHPARPFGTESVTKPSSVLTRSVRSARRPSQRLTVVGDVMLDCDLSGAVERIAPDAPVPVVNLSGRTLRPGGAGLAALLATEDRYQVTLITALGSNPEAIVTRNLLKDAGVRVIDLGSQRPTPVKTRIRVAGQTLLRLDRTTPPELPGALPAEGLASLRAADAVLVSDYGRGVAAAEGIRPALAALVQRVPVVWDPHPRGAVPIAGLSVVTPNDREAMYWAPELGMTGLSGDVARARWLWETWRVNHVVVTRSERGAVMVADKSSPPLVVPAPAAYLGDSCGAGDRLAAALATSLGSGRLPSEALQQAVIAAAEYVKDRQLCVGDRFHRAYLNDAVGLAADVRSAGGTVVATGGCFDLLHRGHLSLFQQARQLGDCLIVCLNSDSSVARVKGAGRPLVSAGDRAYLLSRISDVDAVLIFDEDTPMQALARIRPNIYVKGGDYAVADIPERIVVEQYGGQVVMVPYLDGRSTTSLIAEAARVSR